MCGTERTLALFKARLNGVKFVAFRKFEYLEALKEALLTVALTESDQSVSEHLP